MEAIDMRAKDMVFYLGMAFGGASQYGPKVVGLAVAGQLNNGGWHLIASPEVCLQAAFAAWEEDGTWETEEARDRARDQAREGLEEGLQAFGLTWGKVEEKWQAHQKHIQDQLKMLKEEEAQEETE